MDIITIKAPAKLNLSLDIVGVRENGYHLLEMIMQTIDLYDTLILRRSQETVLFCSDPTLPCGEENLAVRAARSFFVHTGLKDGVEIHLEKRIPHGAGMGGGSADAAAVLKGLNQLYRTGLTEKQLCEIGLSLGADVPYCIVGGTQLVQGIGERLLELKPCFSCFFVVVKPKEGISTIEAYKRYDQMKDVHHPRTNDLMQYLYEQDLMQFCTSMGNVLEAAADLPDIDEIEQIMMEYGVMKSQMTGSGSAVFGIFHDEEQALECKGELEKKYAQVYFCHPVQQ